MNYCSISESVLYACYIHAIEDETQFLTSSFQAFVRIQLQQLSIIEFQLQWGYNNNPLATA